MEIIIGLVIVFFLLAIIIVGLSALVEFIFGMLGWLLVGGLIVGGLIVVSGGEPAGWVAVVLGGIILLSSGG